MEFSFKEKKKKKEKNQKRGIEKGRQKSSKTRIKQIISHYFQMERKVTAY